MWACSCILKMPPITWLRLFDFWLRSIANIAYRLYCTSQAILMPQLQMQPWRHQVKARQSKSFIIVQHIHTYSLIQMRQRSSSAQRSTSYKI